MFAIFMIARHLPCARYNFGSSVKKATYNGFAHSGSSPRDENAFSAKFICDKWKSGWRDDFLLANVLSLSISEYRYGIYFCTDFNGEYTIWNPLRIVNL
jgi:hypothetical protein